MNEDLPASSPPRGRLLAGTIKVSLCVAILSYAATHFLSGAQLDRQSMDQLVAKVTGGVAYDPPTTGSLAAGANQARLDPCATDLRRR